MESFNELCPFLNDLCSGDRRWNRLERGREGGDRRGTEEELKGNRRGTERELEGREKGRKTSITEINLPALIVKNNRILLVQELIYLSSNLSTACHGANYQRGTAGSIAGYEYILGKLRLLWL